MVERSPQTPSGHSDWWPQLSDPLRRIGARIAEFFAPAADAASTRDSYVLEIELPGVKESDIHVELEDSTLFVRGEKRSTHEEKGKTYYFSERTFGAFQRVFRLAPDVDPNGISAEFEDGVLTVRLNKRGNVGQPKRRIEIGRR